MSANITDAEFKSRLIDLLTDHHPERSAEWRSAMNDRLNGQPSHLDSAPKSSSAAVAAAALGSESGKENIIATSPATDTVDIKASNSDLFLIAGTVLCLFLKNIELLIRLHTNITAPVEAAMVAATSTLIVIFVICAIRISCKRMVRSPFSPASSSSPETANPKSKI